MMASNQLNQFKGELAENKSNINWNDFNYPIKVHVIHYSLDDIPDQSNCKWAKMLE